MARPVSRYFMETVSQAWKKHLIANGKRPSASKLWDDTETQLYIDDPRNIPFRRVKGKWNSLRSYERWVKDQAPSVEDVLTPSEMDKPWSIMDSARLRLGSLKLIRDVYLYCSVIDEQLTVHQAIWLDRLSELLEGTHENDGLIIYPEQALAIVNMYISREKNKDFDTRDIDSWLFVKTNNHNRNQRLESVMQKHQAISYPGNQMSGPDDLSRLHESPDSQSHIFVSTMQRVEWSDGVEGLPSSIQVRSRTTLIRMGQDEISRVLRKNLPKEQVDYIHRFDAVYGGDPIYANLDRRKSLLATYAMNQLAKGRNWNDKITHTEKYETVLAVLQWADLAGEGGSQVPQKLLDLCGVSTFIPA